MFDWGNSAYIRHLVCFIACIGISVSSLEWLFPLTKLGRSGLLSLGCSGTARAERLWRPHGLRLVLILRFACAALFIASSVLESHTAPWGIAAFGAGLLCLPLRLPKPVGVFSGMDGAEHLMASTLLVLGATYLLETDLALEVAIVFVATQALFEYASAGLSKLRDWRGWLSGAYMYQVFSSSNYGHRQAAQLVGLLPPIGGIISFAAVAIELAIVFAVLLPAPLGELILLAGLAFHVTAASIMGLNTFVWAFPATYPAILHARDLLFQG